MLALHRKPDGGEWDGQNVESAAKSREEMKPSALKAEVDGRVGRRKRGDGESSNSW